MPIQTGFGKSVEIVWELKDSCLEFPVGRFQQVTAGKIETQNKSLTFLSIAALRLFTLFVSCDVSPFFSLKVRPTTEQVEEVCLELHSARDGLCFLLLFNFPILFSECVTHLHLRRKPFLSFVTGQSQTVLFSMEKVCVRAHGLL